MTARATGPVISAVVMHHPARGPVDALVDACRPLDVRVVEDPDPSGPPSPLRTAKVAWAAIAPGATHHLVLQDDVTPVADFAEHLHHVVRNRDRHALALYTNWNSPHNAYLVRSAAVSGQVWAPLGHHEWVPTLGLVLPADAARRLAEHLATFPDDYRDDDEAVVTFCAKEGHPVVATVPHLLEHGNGPSLAGNAAHGPRHATVPAGARVLPVDRWSTPGVDAFPARRSQARSPVAVELRDSRCTVRVLRPHVGEPLEHPFGWDWADWSWWLGADPQVVASAVADLPVPSGAAHLPGRLRTEVGAAAFLLGFDASHTAWPGGAPSAVGPAPGAALPGHAERDAAIRTWVLSGLARPDERTVLGLPERVEASASDQGGSVLEALVGFGLSALDAGALAAGGSVRAARAQADASPGAVPTGPVTEAAAELVLREARTLTGGAAAPPPTDVELLTCPWCGTRGEQVLGRLTARHGAGGAVRYGSASNGSGGATLAGASAGGPARAHLQMLACEEPSIRGFLALTRHGAARYRTRAVHLTGLLPSTDGYPSPDEVLAALPELARAERAWWDGSAAFRDASPGILPVSSGRPGSAGNVLGVPHVAAGLGAGALDHLARTCRELRLTEAARLL